MGLPIIRQSTKQVGVDNGGTSSRVHETEFPIPHLSKQAKKADSFTDCPTSLLSVGKTADDGTISVFTKEGVTVYNEKEVLITCKGTRILIRTRDSRSRYRIPLVQQQVQWQPRRPSQKARVELRQANSVYDLPSTWQAIKCMHAVYGYPVKSTWLKAIQSGNFVGWSLLKTKNVQKYYPESTETPKGHMNQTRKNVRSTKTKPLETAHNNQLLRSQKKRDVYTKVYNVRETIFSDQTGKFPKQSLRSNKYIMVLVEIDSNAIMVEPMKSQKGVKLTRAYRGLMQQLHRVGIVPKTYILDNEVSKNMKAMIRDKFKMEMELVPPS